MLLTLLLVLVHHFANSQYSDPNGDQRSKSPEQLAGNSRARANINLSGDAAG
jgi:hypothetical protein